VKTWTRVWAMWACAWPGRASRIPCSGRSATAADAERVRAHAEPERLERQCVSRWDVAEIHIGAETAHEPDLLILARRVEHDPRGINFVHDLVDQPLADLAVRPEDPSRAGLPALGDDLPGTRLELCSHLLHPEVGRSDRAGVVLGPDLGEHGELARQPTDQIELVVVAQNYAEAEALTAKMHPAVIWLDMHVTNGDSIAEIRRLRRLSPDSCILALADVEDEQEGFAAIMAGAQGYRSKQDGKGRSNTVRRCAARLFSRPGSGTRNGRVRGLPF